MPDFTIGSLSSTREIALQKVVVGTGEVLFEDVKAAPLEKGHIKGWWKQKRIPGIKPHHLSYLFLLSPYLKADYNYFMDKYHGNPLTKKEMYENKLGISRNSFGVFWAFLVEENLVQKHVDEDGLTYFFFNPNFIARGRVFKKIYDLFD